MLLIAALTLAAGCTSGNTVFGNILPSTFQFRTVIEHEGRGPGGWQGAQVLVLLGRLSTMFPRTAVCQIEVGMPVRNFEQGYISVGMAQNGSAIASDKAAGEILGQRTKPTATICRLFRAKMEYFLASAEVGTIAGARVSQFRTWPGKNVPRRTFPPRRGR